MTLKQQIFIDTYINTLGNATKSALSAYSCKSRNVAGVIGNENLRKLKIQTEINRLLDKAGLSEEATVVKLRNNLHSYRSLNSIKVVLKLKGLI